MPSQWLWRAMRSKVNESKKRGTTMSMSMSLRWFVLAMSINLIASVAIAAPKEKPRKGKPADQAILDLGATYTTNAQTRVDGNIDDWSTLSPLSFQTLIAGEYEYDWTGPQDLSAKVMAQYSEDRIYFLIQVKDNAVVSKKKQWKSDRVELWIAPESPTGKSLGAKRGILLDIGPMVDGGEPTVKFMSGKQGGVAAKAFIGTDGYDFEVGVDFAARGKTSPVMDGVMRYCVLVRDWDQDDPNEDEAAIATCPINPKKSSAIKTDQMGKISLNLADEIWSKVASQPDLQDGQTWTKYTADVAGTSTPEIVALGSTKLVVAGIGMHGDGLSWSVIDLPQNYEGTGAVEFKDISGDKKNEIIVRRSEHCTNGAIVAQRTYIFALVDGVLKLKASYLESQTDENDASNFVQNTYRWTKTGFEQKLGKSAGAEMTRCDPALDAETIPMLMPNDGEKMRKHDFL